ncbi:lysophosphatidylcholine acyltransferase 1 isoform X1 [Manis javanica]|uniref:lysophosphatidylcholine acyltransferase 1 isoform X1 n=1 Tax=Manis javanica TaxID=9974 RepID=UPI0018790767|nr:lysophosphatidylcholine acyltransferase 1 isoform X1 [Manis javanica]KAI5938789.1 Lysophosphatidylcholine acyltransferase 1 [Manis javanica]
MRLRARGPRDAPASGFASSAGAGDARRLAPPGRNPFVHELRLGALRKAQVAVLTVTLFPIRLLFATFMMLLAWPLAFLASLGSDEREPEQPLALWRKVVDFLLKAIMRIMWFAGGFHWVAVKGRQALPTEATILTLAPHSSYFDAIPVTMTMSSIVMKAESRDIPIWGTLIKYIRPVFVSRSDQASRRKTVEEIRRRAQSNGKWPQIMIFPEGTCTNRTCLITFKPGAFIPGVPVQPVVLRYPNKLDTITWTWQGPGALEILWLTLCQFHNQVEIEFLPVYSPSEEERKDPALYASNVRRVMADALGVSITDYTFEDCQLALAEGQLRLPTDTCLLEFARLVRGLGLKPEKLKKDLDKYSESARRKNGDAIDLPEFAAYLEVPLSDTLGDMFSLFDESGGGRIDLREYVVALSVVCRPARTLDTVQLAFKMYGSQEDSSIDEGALSSILKTALGVAELPVTDLFKVIDQEEKGRITFADFDRFVEMCPNFAEEYLYPHHTRSESCAQIPPAPSPNGFCADFSPENPDTVRKPFCKKLD